MGFFDKVGKFFANPAVAIGTELAGDYLGSEAAESANKRSIASNEREAERDRQAQKEFAQMGIRWRVEDAKAAGIHPLAALGSGGASYSPTAVMTSPDMSKADFFQRTGQNVSRAISASLSSHERTMAALQLEREKKQNQLLDLEILERQKQVLSPGSSAGATTQPFSGDPVDVNDDVLAAKVWNALGFRGPAPHRARMGQERGYRPDVSFSNRDGVLVPQIPESLSESMEDDVIGKALWSLAHRVKPNFGAGRMPPREDLPPGYKRWRWSFTKQGWIPEKRDYKTWFER